jgi:glucan-binding YG repeat protein
MQLVGIIGTAILSLILGVAAPAHAQQEQRDQQEQKDRPARQEEKNVQPEKRKTPQDERQPQQERQRAQPEKTQQDRPTQQNEQRATEARPVQQNEHQAQQNNQHAQQQEQPQHNEQPRRTQEQQRVQQSAWQQDRARSWQSDHRTWQQRGGYNGYRIPDDRFRGYFGPGHGFRIYGLPFLVVGGYPRFQYGGYWITAIDPWPEYWAADWYDTDDVYVAYVDNGYYLFNRRYPGAGIAVSISM